MNENDELRVALDATNKRIEGFKPADPGQISDGYHTFNELYEHRHVLYCAFVRLAALKKAQIYCWKSRIHWIDGKLEPCWEGWFLAGCILNADDQYSQIVTYHLPISYWDLFWGEELATPIMHDGHTSNDVIERFRKWLVPKQPGVKS